MLVLLIGHLPRGPPLVDEHLLTAERLECMRSMMIQIRLSSIQSGHSALPMIKKMIVIARKIMTNLKMER